MNALYQLILNSIQITEMKIIDTVDIGHSCGYTSVITGDTQVEFKYSIVINGKGIYGQDTVFIIDLCADYENTICSVIDETIEDYCKNWVLEYYGFFTLECNE